MSSLRPFEPVSASAHALAALREAIITGEIRQGEPLREARIAQQLGTSRGIVREALRQLVQEGLVEHEVHRGVFVRTITTADIIDVYRAREAIETAAVEAICAGAALSDWGRLDECVDQMRIATDAGSWRQSVDADLVLHEELVGLADSTRLSRMYATLVAETRMHLYQHPPYPLGRNLSDHREIVEAVKGRSPRATILLREHLRGSAKIVRESRWAGAAE